MRKQYEISDDFGHTWKIVWLTEKEVEVAVNNFWLVREV